MQDGCLKLYSCFASLGYCRMVCDEDECFCANGTAYLFSYFINDSRDGLRLAYSYDGLNWTALNGGKSYLTPAVGKDKLMRDPSICQAPIISDCISCGRCGVVGMENI